MISILKMWVRLMISILFNTLCGCTQMCNMFYSCSKSQEQNGTINDINIYSANNI